MRAWDARSESGLAATMAYIKHSLSEIHLVELLDACHRPPAAHQRGSACGLTDMRQTSFYLLADNFIHVDLEGRQLPTEAPCLGGLVWWPRLRKRHRIARARPRRVQCHASD